MLLQAIYYIFIFCKINSIDLAHVLRILYSESQQNVFVIE